MNGALGKMATRRAYPPRFDLKTDQTAVLSTVDFSRTHPIFLHIAVHKI